MVPRRRCARTSAHALACAALQTEPCGAPRAGASSNTGTQLAACSGSGSAAQWAAVAQPSWALQGCFADNAARTLPSCLASGGGVVSSVTGTCAWGYSSAQCQAAALANGFNTFALQNYGSCLLCRSCSYAALGAATCPVAYPACDAPGGTSGGNGNCGGACGTHARSVAAGAP